MLCARIILFTLCTCMLASARDNTPIQFPDGTVTELTWEDLHTVMGKGCTLDHLSHPDKLAAYWTGLQRTESFKRYSPSTALRIILNHNRKRILHRCPTLAHVTQEATYDLVPPSAYDTRETAPWRKMYTAISIMGIIAEIEATPNAPDVFAHDYIAAHPHIKKKIVTINSFLTQGLPHLQAPLFAMSQLIRHTAIEPAAVLCPKLCFTIASFIALMQQGYLLCPFAIDFNNCHEWGAHKAAYVGINRLLYHDAEHILSMVMGEQIGRAFHAHTQDPFLPFFTQHNMKNIFDMLHDPHTFFYYCELNPAYPLEKTRICLTISHLLKLYNTIHEMPDANTSDLISTPQLASSDKELHTLSYKAFNADPRPINTQDLRQIELELEVTSKPFTPTTLWHLTKDCTKEWLNLDEPFDRCSFAEFLDICDAILSLLIKIDPNIAEPTLPKTSAPPLYYHIYCVPVSGTIMSPITSDKNGATVTVPTRWTIEHHATPAELRFLMHSIRDTIIKLDLHQRSILYTPQNPKKLFFHPAWIFSDVLAKITFAPCITLPSGSLSRITQNTLQAIIDSTTTTQLQSPKKFQDVWENLLFSANQLMSPEDFFELIWQKSYSFINEQKGGFYQLAEKDAYNRLPCIQPAFGQYREWQKCLSLLTVYSILKRFSDALPLTRERLQRLTTIWKDCPEQIAEIRLIMSFPREFLITSISQSVFIISQLQEKFGLRVHITPQQACNIPILNRLAAMHEGIVRISLPLNLSDCYNSQSYYTTDTMLKKCIIEPLCPLLATESVGRALHHYHDNSPFLQHWAQSAIAAIQSDIQACTAEHPSDQNIIAILSKILCFDNQIQSATNVLPTQATQIPPPIRTDRSFYMACKSIYDTLHGEAPSQSDIFASLEQSCHWVVPYPTQHELERKTQACQSAWGQPTTPFNLTCLAKITHCIFTNMPNHNIQHTGNTSIDEGSNSLTLYGHCTNSTIVMPIFCNDGTALVSIPHPSTVHHITTKFEARIMEQSALLTIEDLTHYGRTKTVRPLIDFITELYKRTQ